VSGKARLHQAGFHWRQVPQRFEAIDTDRFDLSTSCHPHDKEKQPAKIIRTLSACTVPRSGFTLAGKNARFHKYQHFVLRTSWNYWFTFDATIILDTEEQLMRFDLIDLSNLRYSSHSSSIK
jgi:hypothetical protein